MAMVRRKHRRTAAIGNPLHRLRQHPSVLWLQVLGTVAIALLAGLWLQIPDSHVWQLFLSFVVGIGVVFAALTLEIVSFRQLRGGEGRVVRQRLLIAVAILAAWIAVLWLLNRPVDWLEDHAELYAGYWNSQLSRSLRHTLTYSHLLSGIQFVAALLSYWLLPALCLPFAMETAVFGFGRACWKRAVHVFWRWQYWLGTLLLTMAGWMLTTKLVNWMPGTTVRRELLSVGLRLALAYGVDILCWCVVMALTAACLAAAETAVVTGAAVVPGKTPEESGTIRPLPGSEEGSDGPHTLPGQK